MPLRLCNPLADLARLHARDRPGRARAFRPHVARRQPAGEPARAAGRGAAALARARGLRAVAGRARRDRRARRRHPRARRLHRPRRAPRRVARRRACPGRALLLALLGGALRVARAAAVPASRWPAGSQGLLLALAWPLGARVTPAPARPARHVPGRRPGRCGPDRGAGTAGARRHRPAGGTRRASAARARRRRRSTRSFLSHDERDHDGRAAAILRALDVALLVTPALPGTSASLADARRSRARARHARRARPRRTRARARRRRSCASSARGTRRARRRRTTPRWSCSRARGRARSCCRRMPSRRCCWRRARRRRACSRSRTTARPTPLLDAPAGSRAPAPRRHLGGRAQPLRPSRRRRRSQRSPQAGVPVRRTDLEGDISLACRARRMTRLRSRAMSAAPLDPVYLIGGTDRPKVELAIRRLRARVRSEDGSVEEFTARRHDDDGEGMSGEEAAGACNALGLFGGTRLIVVQGAEVWGDDKKAAADVEALAAYLPAPAPDAVLALLDGGRGARRPSAHARRGGRQRARLRPARQARASASGCASRPRAPAPTSTAARSRACSSWPATTRRRSRARSRSSGCGRAARRSPPSASTSCACSRPTRRRGISPTRSAIAGPADALRVLGRLLDGPDGDVPRWVPSIARHLRQLAVAQHVGEQGGGPKDIARELGLRSEFVARKLARQSARWTRGAALRGDRAHRLGRARDARRGRAARPLRARARAHRGRRPARAETSAARLRGRRGGARRTRRARAPALVQREPPPLLADVS